jgi:hypothetical protein
MKISSVCSPIDCSTCLHIFNIGFGLRRSSPEISLNESYLCEIPCGSSFLQSNLNLQHMLVIAMECRPFTRRTRFLCTPIISSGEITSNDRSELSICFSLQAVDGLNHLVCELGEDFFELRGCWPSSAIPALPAPAFILRASISRWKDVRRFLEDLVNDWRIRGIRCAKTLSQWLAKCFMIGSVLSRFSSASFLDQSWAPQRLQLEVEIMRSLSIRKDTLSSHNGC